MSISFSEIILGLFAVIVIIAINYFMRLTFLKAYNKYMNKFYELKYERDIKKFNAQKNTDLGNKKN
jgi:hypothetical protein